MRNVAAVLCLILITASCGSDDASNPTSSTTPPSSGASATLATEPSTTTTDPGSTTTTTTTTTTTATTTTSVVTTTTTSPPPTQGECAGDFDVAGLDSVYQTDVDGDAHVDSVLEGEAEAAVDLAYGSGHEATADWIPYRGYQALIAGVLPIRTPDTAAPALALDLDGDRSSEIVLFTAEAAGETEAESEGLVRYASFATFKDCALQQVTLEGDAAWFSWTAAADAGPDQVLDSHIVCRDGIVAHIVSDPTMSPRDTTITRYQLEGTEFTLVDEITGSWTAAQLFGEPGTIGDANTDPADFELRCGAFVWGDS